MTKFVLFYFYYGLTTFQPVEQTLTHSAVCSMGFFYMQADFRSRTNHTLFQSLFYLPLHAISSSLCAFKAVCAQNKLKPVGLVCSMRLSLFYIPDFAIEQTKPVIFLQNKLNLYDFCRINYYLPVEQTITFCRTNYYYPLQNKLNLGGRTNYCNPFVCVKKRYLDIELMQFQ